jgi:type II secretory pathway component GspD/PulD (secretin)
MREGSVANVVTRHSRPLTVAGVRFLSALALAWPCGQAFAAEPNWPAGLYKYVVIDQDIRDLLVEFGRNIDIPVKMSDQVKGRIHGPFEITTAEQFLKNICASLGLIWYFDGSVMHINVAREIETAFIDLGRLPPNELSAKLVKLGYADPRYPIKTTASADVVSVSGPPPYLSLIRQTVAAMLRSAPRPAREENVPDEPRVRVFRGG